MTDVAEAGLKCEFWTMRLPFSIICVGFSSVQSSPQPQQVAYHTLGIKPVKLLASVSGKVKRIKNVESFLF